MQERILVVDDERDILRLLKYNLEKEGYSVSMASDGAAALTLALDQPDLVILDIMMPIMDGWEVIRRLKRDPKTSNIPVLFLTARAAEFEEVVGLELGAEDYITKPISPRKLVARIKAVLRRRIATNVQQEPVETIRLPHVTINLASYSIHVDDTERFFPKKEFEILAHLARNRGRVVSRESILDAVWGRQMFVMDRTIDVHVRGIREKLGAFAHIIETVKGVGYRIKEESAERQV
jgi:two-component system, OmpR family, alkaline phosphatase synthesis response regulator PhoP